MLRWVLKPHQALQLAELYAILQLRSAVFVVEQNCVFLDMDGADLTDDNQHLMVWNDQQLLGCLRLLDPATHDGEVVIGRVVTAPAARQFGLGHALMEQALRHGHMLWPHTSFVLSAQAHLEGFYAQHGFVAYGEPYDEDGIPHIGMRRAALHTSNDAE